MPFLFDSGQLINKILFDFKIYFPFVCSEYLEAYMIGILKTVLLFFSFTKIINILARLFTLSLSLCIFNFTWGGEMLLIYVTVTFIPSYETYSSFLFLQNFPAHLTLSIQHLTLDIFLPVLYNAIKDRVELIKSFYNFIGRLKMKKIFLFIIIPIITFAQEDPLHTGECIITLINYGTSWNVTFTATAVTERWDENYYLTADYETATVP